MDENVNSRNALRDAAEDQLGNYQDGSRELRDKTSEENIHELQVHQIELEMQNEELLRWAELEIDASFY